MPRLKTKSASFEQSAKRSLAVAASARCVSQRYKQSTLAGSLDRRSSARPSVRPFVWKSVRPSVRLSIVGWSLNRFCVAAAEMFGIVGLAAELVGCGCGCGCIFEMELGSFSVLVGVGAADGWSGSVIIIFACGGGSTTCCRWCPMLLLLFYQREGFKRFLCMSRHRYLGLAAAAAFYTGNNYLAFYNFNIQQQIYRGKSNYSCDILLSA